MQPCTGPACDRTSASPGVFNRGNKSASLFFFSHTLLKKSSRHNNQKKNSHPMEHTSRPPHAKPACTKSRSTSCDAGVSSSRDPWKLELIATPVLLSSHHELLPSLTGSRNASFRAPSNAQLTALLRVVAARLPPLQASAHQRHGQCQIKVSFHDVRHILASTSNAHPCLPRTPACAHSTR